MIAKTIASTFLTVLLCGVAPLTLGADFPERIASEQRSAMFGLGVNKLYLIKRLPGPGVEQTMSILLDRLYGRLPGIFTSDRFQREVTEERTSIVSDEGWYIDVYADGSNVRYRNYRYLEDVKHMARPVKERLSQEKLEMLGLAFITEHLDGLVQLGEDEELVPYFSEFEITGGGPAKEGESMEPELVHASTVVFRRVIDGQPVVGGGSKIAVIFANDEEPVGFDYDWPTYSKSRTVQNILPLDQILRRGKKYSILNPDEEGVDVLHFDCGYVDLGARKRDPAAMIQGGCMRQATRKFVIDRNAHAKDKRSGHVLSASLDYLPAGEKVARDKVWELARNSKVDLPEAINE